MMLELDGIRHKFPDSDWELHVPTFSLTQGKLLCVIGPNGSGKSTLLRIASGVLVPIQGSVRMREQDIFKLNRRAIARQLGYLPQETASLYDFTVEEIVRMGRYPHTRGMGSLDRTDLEVIQQSLRLTEMDALAQRPLSRLSGGERKRAFLASVLAQKPQILLLDEPTGALDIHHQVQFFRLLLDLARAGMAIAVATHEINLASLFSDTLLVLSGGKLVESGPPGQVLTPATIQAVYGETVFMGRHPQADRPAIFPQITPEKKREE